MIFIFLLCLISSFLGAIWGRHLAIQWVTAANALEKHQRIVYIILMAIASLVASLRLTGSIRVARKTQSAAIKSDGDAVVAMSLPLAALLYYLLPVTSILGTPLVLEGVVNADKRSPHLN